MDKPGVLKFIKESGLPADIKEYFVRIAGSGSRAALKAALKKSPTALIANIDRLLGAGSGILGCSKEEELFITGFNKNDIAPERFEAALAELRAVVFLNREGFCDLKFIRQNCGTSADIFGAKGAQNYVFEVCCLQADKYLSVDYLELKYDKKKRQMNSSRRKYKCGRCGLFFVAKPADFKAFVDEADLQELAKELYERKKKPEGAHICILSGNSGAVFPAW